MQERRLLHCMNSKTRVGGEQMLRQQGRLSQAPTYTDKKARPFSKKLSPTKSAALPYTIPKAVSSKKLYATKNRVQQKATFLTILFPPHCRLFMFGDLISIPSPKSTTTKKGSPPAFP